MNNFFKGLFVKIYGLILVPSLAFLLLGILKVSEQYKVYSRNNLINNRAPLIRSSFLLLSNLQIERGMSVSHISGANNWEKIEKQKKLVDERIANYRLLSSQDPQARVQLNMIDNILKLRPKIQSKLTVKKEIVSIYTQAIRSLLKKTISLSHISKDTSIIQTLTNIHILSEGMENGGLLRANMSGLLARGTLLSPQEKELILALKSKFDAFSESPALEFIVQKNSELHQVFLNLNEHNIVQNSFMQMINNNLLANQKISSVEFFSIISVLLKNLEQIIIYEINFLEEQSAKNFQEALNQLIVLIFILTIYLIGATIYTSRTVLKLVQAFRVSLHTLNNKTFTIALATEHLNNNSKRVLHDSQNQTKEIEEVSHSINQMKSLQDDTSEKIRNSKNYTDSTFQDAKQGQSQVEKMLHAIDQILKSNNEIESQVIKNNQSFEKVTEIINQIANKTSIINDIVFQTKLLSFNASVEAARAGEHGKGFSIVAEEIGQLATLSGSASHEISELVSSSIKLVTSVTSEMSEKMENIVTQNNQNIQIGNQEALNCSKQFKQTVESVTKIHKVIQDVTKANQNQNKALQTISQNIISLEKATKSNLDLTDKNFLSSDKIAQNTKLLKKVVNEMCLIIRGEIIQNHKEDTENETQITNNSSLAA